MAAGYGGTYRASVVDNADPLTQDRLSVLVPDVGYDATWARPCFSPGSVDLPAVGDEVLISFEGGDSDYPVWQTLAGGEPVAPAGDGYAGVYRAIVIDNADPGEASRLQVSVPEVWGSDAAWATPATSLGDGPQLPEIGAEIWVQFDGGDPSYPIWLGVD